MILVKMLVRRPVFGKHALAPRCADFCVGLGHPERAARSFGKRDVTMSTDIQHMLDRIWAAVEARLDIIRGEAVSKPVVSAIDEPVRESRIRDDFAVLDHLDAALSLAKANVLSDLAEEFDHTRDNIQWSQNLGYTAENSVPGFLEGYAYASLAGPEGPVLCSTPRAGYMLLGPNVTYPDHQHEPREIYLVLTPGCQWRLDSGEWFDVNAGDLIVHQSWQKHATRTGDQPFLAFAGWLDDGDRNGINWA